MALSGWRAGKDEDHERAYGARARIGLIVPSDNTVMETEMWRMAPVGVSVHTARLLFGDVADSGFDDMDAHLPRALRELRTADVTAIAYACTSSALENDPEPMVSLIQESVRVPAVATFGALLAALSRLNVQRISLGTPYPQDINAQLVSFLEARGIQVVAVDNIMLFPEQELLTGIARIPLAAVRHLAHAVDRSDADAIVLSCTDLPTLPIIASLEAELGKPVITSCQATAWQVLRAAGISDSQPDGGRLFDLV